jgi:hypothetical protein
VAANGRRVSGRDPGVDPLPLELEHERSGDPVRLSGRPGHDDRAIAARVDNWTELDASQRDEHLRPEVAHYIRDHEKRVPLVVAARLGRILTLYGVGQELDLDHRVHRHEKSVVQAGLASWYLLAGMAVAGGVALRRRRDVPIWPLIAVPAIVVIAVALTFRQTRYRAPPEPVVVLLAAVAADAWLRRRAARRPTGHEGDAEAARAPEPGTVPSPA